MKTKRLVAGWETSYLEKDYRGEIIFYIFWTTGKSEYLHVLALPFFIYFLTKRKFLS